MTCHHVKEILHIYFPTLETVVARLSMVSDGEDGWRVTGRFSLLGSGWQDPVAGLNICPFFFFGSARAKEKMMEWMDENKPVALQIRRNR